MKLEPVKVKGPHTLIGLVVFYVFGAGAICVAGGCNLTSLIYTTPWLVVGAAVLMHSARELKYARRSQLNEQLAGVYRDTTQALAYAIASKDSYEKNHVERVKKICELVSDQLGLDEYTKAGVILGATLHDVGKLGVPEYILLKPGPLDTEEYGKMRNHASIGAQILATVDYPWDVAGMIKHHHEKYDGTGYPDHLVGDQIPIGSRIISVAETYDSLVSDRCYRDGWTHAKAVEHIEKLSGTHFDPQVVSAFLRVENLVEESLRDLADCNQCELAETGVNASQAISSANRELMSLFDIAQTLSATLELDEVLDMLAHRTRRLVESDSCAVYIVDDDNPKYVQAITSVGRHKEQLKGSRIRLGHGQLGKALARQETANTGFESGDIMLEDESCEVLDFSHVVCSPITSFGKLIGAILVSYVACDNDTDEIVRTINMVASRAALAIQNATAFEEVRDSAMSDPLTGLHNCRFMRGFMDSELNRAGRNKTILSVIAIDLDNFKAINDTYGHNVGDIVLKDVSDIFREEIRDYDKARRYGGDEFVLILPGTPQKNAKNIADRIEEQVEVYATRFSLKGVTFGVSCGVASYPDDGEDMDTLLARADESMYKRKREKKGRDMAA